MTGSTTDTVPPPTQYPHEGGRTSISTTDTVLP
jgi:hypothetical protein